MCCPGSDWTAAARVVVRGTQTGWTAFPEAAGPGVAADPVRPADPALVLLTSGTTSGSKAVVHSTASMLSVPERFWRWNGYSWADRSFVAAPLGHAGGMASAFTVPLVTGSSVVLRDHWDPIQAVEDMRRHAVTYCGGSAVFVRELVDAIAASSVDQLPLRVGFYCGASAIPEALAREAEWRGLRPNRAYGMTECPYVSASLPFDPVEIRTGTDGRVLPGGQVRVTGTDGRPVAPGHEGELWVRGPQRACGYLDRADTEAAFTEQGWFRTGDLGAVSADEIVTITGRVKDIINRGGEKLSAQEIEAAILGHPDVVDAAVVAQADARLGEAPAAFIKTRRPVPDAELVGFLTQAGLAKQKIPVRWSRVSEFERTPTGKIKKAGLVARLVENPAVAKEISG